jgi:hypothetical protein
MYSIIYSFFLFIMFYSYSTVLFLVSLLFFGLSRNGFLVGFFLPLANTNHKTTMKKITLLLAAATFITACSSPKYTYHFDTHNYNAGNKNISPEFLAAELNKTEILAQKNDLHLNAPVMASTKVMVIETKTAAEKVTSLADKYKLADLNSKTVRKEIKTDIKKLQKTLKTQIKENSKTPLTIEKNNRMDNDLKMGAIFGSIGIVLLLISGDVFLILGAISLIIGLVFFIQWLARQ